MRLSFFLLVLANLVFFAWAQGYFGLADEGHEPQRLERQLNAEKLRILRDAGPSAAAKNPTACRVINGLTMANAETLKAALTSSGAEAKLLPLPGPTLHLVIIGDLANKAAADKKLAELLKLGVDKPSAVALADGRHEIVLGSFSADAGAQEFLQGLTKRGIKSARVDAREQAALKARIEARGPATNLLQELPKLIAPYADATIGECAQ